MQAAAQARAAQAIQVDQTPTIGMAPAAAAAPAPAAGPVVAGPPWQHTYPVELDTGARLEICWNSGEDPNAIAMRFLSANPHIPKDQAYPTLTLNLNLNLTPRTKCPTLSTSSTKLQGKPQRPWQ